MRKSDINNLSVNGILELSIQPNLRVCAKPTLCRTRFFYQTHVTLRSGQEKCEGCTLLPSLFSLGLKGGQSQTSPTTGFIASRVSGLLIPLTHKKLKLI